MDSLKEQRIAVEFCVLVILDKKFSSSSEIKQFLTSDWLFGRQSSGVVVLACGLVSSNSCTVCPSETLLAHCTPAQNVRVRADYSKAGSLLVVANALLVC